MARKQQASGVPPPEQRLGFLLYRVGVEVTREYGERIRPLGFSPVEVGLLTHLASGGESHVRAIARTIGVSPQTIVNVTTILESRQLVTRLKIGPDQRLVRIGITNAGLSELAKVEAIVNTFDQEIQSQISKENIPGITRGLKELLLGLNRQSRGRR